MNNLRRSRTNALHPSCRRRHGIDAAMLENRILWSASPIVLIDPETQPEPILSETGIDYPWSLPHLDSVAQMDSATQMDSVAQMDSASPTSPNASEIRAENSNRRLELAFIDNGVQDIDKVLAELGGQRWNDKDFEIFLLDSDRDGIEQIAEILSGFQDVDAVHIFSHGKDGQVRIGNTWLNHDNLSAYTSDLTRWNWAMSSDADLLIYGCDVARTEQGKAFLEALSLLTDTDVAASDDDTGSSSLGGDWTLEFQFGTIDSTMEVSSEFQMTWNSLLAVTAEDPFSPSGNLDGTSDGSGWSTAWSGGGSNLQTNGRSLSDSSGQLQESGGSVRLSLASMFSTANAERQTALSHGTSGTTTWISFVVEPGDTGFASFMGLELGSTGSDVAYAGYNGTSFVLEKAGGSSSQSVAGISAASGQAYFIVLRIDALVGNDTITMYVNPPPGLASPLTPYSVTKTNLDLGNWTRFAISGGRG